MSSFHRPSGLYEHPETGDIRLEAYLGAPEQQILRRWKSKDSVNATEVIWRSIGVYTFVREEYDAGFRIPPWSSGQVFLPEDLAEEPEGEIKRLTVNVNTSSVSSLRYFETKDKAPIPQILDAMLLTYDSLKKVQLAHGGVSLWQMGRPLVPRKRVTII